MSFSKKVALIKCAYCVHSVAVPQSSSEPRTALLTWQVVQKKMPWNIILLLGGGFALAKGSEVKCTEKHASNYNKKFMTFSRHSSYLQYRAVEGLAQAASSKCLVMVRFELMTFQSQTSKPLSYHFI